MKSNEQEATMQKTYETFGAALADPTSHISRFVSDARETMSENEKVIAQWMATGLTREQAWTESLKTCR